MKELVVISGKGGTGKTSIVASFAALAGRLVIADCDVDAADLHLVLEPKIVGSKPFIGGKVARVNQDMCSACGTCKEVCRLNAIVLRNDDGRPGGQRYEIDEIACEGCGACSYFCPEGAITLEDSVDGEWYVSDTRYGPMVHARLKPGGENSGKLVTLVREHAKKKAEQNGLELIIVDGSPGVGCPVIASITGADMALLVAEPSLSGMHDLWRAGDLATHFNIPVAVCINKHDINPRVTADIEAQTVERGWKILGKIEYDPAVTEAQFNMMSVVEFSQSPASGQIKTLWQRVIDALES